MDARLVTSLSAHRPRDEADLVELIAATAASKGHLLIEEALDTVISEFVFHPEFIQAANLRFAQKLSIARAMSLDEHDNEMWGLASGINSLRNELAHSLRSSKRAARIQAVLDLYFRLADNAPTDVRNQPISLSSQCRFTKCSRISARLEVA